MTDTPSKTTTRRPDCVTEIRMGNNVLTSSRTPPTPPPTKWRKSWRPKAAARSAPARDLLPVVPR